MNDTNSHNYSYLSLHYVQFLQKEFLPYLKAWEVSVTKRTGQYSKKERVRMMISSQTLRGLRITGMAIFFFFLCILSQQNFNFLQSTHLWSLCH